MGSNRLLPGMLLGLVIGFGAGWWIWGDDLPSIPELAEVADASEWETDAVLVVAVESKADLAVVRDSVTSSRVVASSEEGFAIEPQRVVVTSLEAAGELLTRAGWDDHPLAIVDVAPRVRQSGAREQELSELAALLNKPTLTRAEAYRLLDSI